MIHIDYLFIYIYIYIYISKTKRTIHERSVDYGLWHKHYVESVRIRSKSGLYFSAFGLNTERDSVSLSIQSKCEKIRTIITPNTDTFYAVKMSIIDQHLQEHAVLKYITNLKNIALSLFSVVIINFFVLKVHELIWFKKALNAIGRCCNCKILLLKEGIEIKEL